jgi:hypothetical protein
MLKTIVVLREQVNTTPQDARISPDSRTPARCARW